MLETDINIKILSDVHVDIVKIVDSTNDELRRRAESGCTGDCVLISEKQTKGKGRRGRSFYSPDGTGIYISLLLHPDMPVDDVQSLTTVMAAAAAVAIEKTTGFDVSIKWVNDLWMRGKKICGILTETSASIKDGIPEYVISGIGINIFEPDGGFPEEIKASAGAVFAESDKIGFSENYDVNKLISITENFSSLLSEKINPLNDIKEIIKFAIAAELIIQFYKFYAELQNSSISNNTPSGLSYGVYAYPQDNSIPGDEYRGVYSNHGKDFIISNITYLNEYKKRLFVIGKDVEILTPDHTSLNKKAHVLGINEKCHLHVKYEDGTEEYLSGGEISIFSLSTDINTKSNLP